MHTLKKKTRLVKLASRNKAATVGRLLHQLLFFKKNRFAPAFGLTLGGGLSIKSGTRIGVGNKKIHIKENKTILTESLKPGTDYAVMAYRDGTIRAIEDTEPLYVSRKEEPRKIGGFHVDCGGKIAEYSIWDLRFRPKCADPRGMVLVGGKFWADIYLLNQEHNVCGTSRAAKRIADGNEYSPELPDVLQAIDTPKEFSNLNWFTAALIAAQHGKQLLSDAEFALAAEGVTEGLATREKQNHTGRFEGLTSKWGLEQATGTIWVWGREKVYSSSARILGGSWLYSGSAGPRLVSYVYPSWSSDGIGVRARSDHQIS